MKDEIKYLLKTKRKLQEGITEIKSYITYGKSEGLDHLVSVRKRQIQLIDNIIKYIEDGIQPKH
jgi:hypothetical protein